MRQLPESIDVLVTDSGGRPVSGITVNFSVSSGGGTLSSPAAQSDNDGMARVSWTLGPELGPQALQATATNATGDPLKNSPLALSAVAGLAQATRIVLVTPPPDTARNGIPFVPQPVLQVFDAENQPVPQVQVVASVSSGGASLSGTTTMTSNDSGQVSFSDLALAGAQGPQTLQFQVTSPAIQVTSNVQLIPGVPATLTGVEPLAYTGTVGSPVSPGPSVVVKDVAGNPVPGVEVTFTATRNASVSPETATTDELGVAQVTWTLGATASISYSLTAQIGSSPIAPVRFSATAQPGAAGRLRISTQPSSPTQSGAPFAQQPAIQVVDQAGNPTPQPGVTVTATISSGPSGTLQGGSAVTDAAGQATFTGLVLTGAVGNYTISFSAPGLTGVTTSPFAITTGSAARLDFVTPPSNAARSRAPLVIQPVLEIQDPSGNTIRQAGVVVTASVSTAQTSLTGETATTDANGRAAFTSLTITGIPGPKDLTFSASGLQSVSARVTLPSVQTVSATPSHPVSATVGSTVAGTVITWTFRDAATRPVADANFTLSFPSGGTANAPATSDANGVVLVNDWTLGATAGYQYIVLQLPDHREFRDSILALPGPAYAIVKVSGDEPIQSAPTDSELPQRFVVRVEDQNHNGVADIPVDWTTCDGTPGPTVNTDANGYSSVTQPTGSQPSGDSPFCTRAAAAVAGPATSVDFLYQVTARSGAATQAGSRSAAESRHTGPPPVVLQETPSSASH